MKIANVKVAMVIIKYVQVTIWEYNQNKGTIWLKKIMLFNVQINMHVKETKYSTLSIYNSYKMVIYIFMLNK